METELLKLLPLSSDWQTVGGHLRWKEERSSKGEDDSCCSSQWRPSTAAAAAAAARLHYCDAFENCNMVFFFWFVYFFLLAKSEDKGSLAANLVISGAQDKQ